MATTHIKQSKSASRLVNYAEKRAVLKEGHNIDIDYAKSEFKQVREIYGNKGSIQAYSSRVAFSPKEFDPKNEKDQQKVLDIAKEIYQKAYPNHQIALYVHNDTNSLHVHAVIGSINLETGKKWHGNWQEYRERLVSITDEVVKNHGLEVTIPNQKSDKQTMSEIKMSERGEILWKTVMKQEIQGVLQKETCKNFDEFKEKLSERGISAVERGKNITYTFDDINKKARGSTLGRDYTKEKISEIIKSNKELYDIKQTIGKINHTISKKQEFNNNYQKVIKEMKTLKKEFNKLSESKPQWYQFNKKANYSSHIETLNRKMVNRENWLNKNKEKQENNMDAINKLQQEKETQNDKWNEMNEKLNSLKQTQKEPSLEQIEQDNMLRTTIKNGQELREHEANEKDMEQKNNPEKNQFSIDEIKERAKEIEQEKGSIHNDEKNIDRSLER